MLWSLLMTGCSLNIPPPDQYSDPDAINNVSSARALLASCYSSFPHYEYDLSVMGNDFCPTSLAGKNADELNLYNWQNKNVSTTSTNIWQDYYTCIANCDVLLDRADNIAASTTDEQQRKAAILAEYKTLKALCYFDLLRLFATRFADSPDADGVVIKQEFGFEVNARSSKRQCASYIESLLTDAATVDHHPSTNGWLSSEAVTYLLAELYLYTERYPEAATLADQLISQADDALLSGTNWQRLWQNESFGARIFAFSTSTSFYTDLQYDEQEGDYYAINPSLVPAPTDARYASAVFTKEMKGAERLLLGKYNRQNKLGTQPTYINRMRYAGAYFIAAEAYVRSGEPAKALERIDHYLGLVGATPLSPTLNDSQLVSAILSEKYKEFAGEGTNWFDLKRAGASLPRLNTWGQATTTLIQPTDYRWTLPIPASEYKYNERITQNEGWPINR